MNTSKPNDQNSSQATLKKSESSDEQGRAFINAKKGFCFLTIKRQHRGC
jgi:hypothetical protein